MRGKEVKFKFAVIYMQSTAEAQIRLKSKKSN